MSVKQWAATVLAGVLAMTGLAAGTSAAAAATDPVSIDDATLEWAYSKYAQAGTMSPWQMSADGSGLEIVQQNGFEVSGDPAESGRSYSVARFSGGTGQIDPVTGEGTISWLSGAQWQVQITAPAGSPPAVLLSNPILEVAADASGTLSFEVGATAGDSMGGAPGEAVSPERVVTQSFTSVRISDGVLTAVPDFDGVDSGQSDQVAEGGSWPKSYIDQLPPSIQAFHYQTSLAGLNLKKGPLPFTVSTGIETGEPGSEFTPRLELFNAAGEPLGDAEVQPGDIITFRGSGFDPEANNPGGDGSGLPIPNDQPQGVFIAFGSVASPWKPSENGPAENRTQVRANTKWALLDSVVEDLPEPLRQTIRASSVTHNADGSFEGEIVAAEPEKIPQNGSWGVYTYAGGATTVNAQQELFVPVNFASEKEDTDTPGLPVDGEELVWGFKESWRTYVTQIAHGSIIPGAGARVDEQGLFHFALDDASGYDPETGEGIVKYEGRIRFMSSEHMFDIVIENPWVTLTDGGDSAVLSLGMSATATPGDLTVTRVDAASLVPGAVGSEERNGVRHLVWGNATGTFLGTLQPTELSRYVGEAIDPLAFAIPAGVDGGSGGANGSGGTGTGGNSDASGGDASGEDASGGTAGSAGSLASTGAAAGDMLGAAAGVLLIAGVVLLVVRRTASVRD